MKWIVILTSMLLAGTSFAGNPTRSIDVYGAAEVAVDPDGINWRLEITTYADSMNEAKSLNDQALSQLKAFLKKGEKVENVEVNNPRLSRTYNALEKKLKPFNAETYLTFQSFAVAQQQHLAVGIAQIPGVEIQSCHWITTNRTEIVKEARTLALHAARTKASEMALALGMEVSLPILIEERSSRWEETGLNIVADQTGVTQDDAGGKVRVGANVRVMFELNEKRNPNQAPEDTARKLADPQR